MESARMGLTGEPTRRASGIGLGAYACGGGCGGGGVEYSPPVLSSELCWICSWFWL